MDITLDKLESPEFWRKLNPQLSICDHPFDSDTPAYELDKNLQARIRMQMIEDGYFHIPSLVDEYEIETLRKLAGNLHENGIMPLFAGLYDEFWKLLYRLRYILSPILRPDYRLIPDFWVWYVDGTETSMGWAPHRDGEYVADNIRADGTPTLCTGWIALTDADTTNSTIYVLPRKHDAMFQDFIRKKFGQPGIPNARNIPMPINHIRALPVKAGSIIGWDQNLLHWGSASTKWASGPRISLGIYYQSNDSRVTACPFDKEGRAFIDYENADSSITFNNRLTILANNMETYGYKLDSKAIQEPNYNSVFREFREKWKWSRPLGTN